MYLVVRKYNIPQGNREEITSTINNGFVPLIKKMQGFQDYYCLYTDTSTLLSVSVFQDEKGATESVRLAADWVGKNLSKYFPEKPEIFAGEVFAHGKVGEAEWKKAG